MTLRVSGAAFHDRHLGAMISLVRRSLANRKTRRFLENTLLLGEGLAL